MSKSGLNSPTLSVAVDPATNRIPAWYDANGNQQTVPGLTATMDYDPENRLVGLGYLNTRYAYDSQNKRIWKGTTDNSGNIIGQEIYVYGLNGQRLGTYGLSTGYSPLGASMTEQAVYFGSKRIGTTNTWGGTSPFVPDRLGSNGKYFPYGEDRNSPAMADDQVKFATYTRDSVSGLDYAGQRYYVNTFGRFMSADPYSASSGPADPKSWNRYSYTMGDPINGIDPTGRVTCFYVDGQLDSCEIDANPGPPSGPGSGTPCTDQREPQPGCTDPTGGGQQSAQDRVYSLAVALQGGVRDGHVTDCNALAAFAGIASTITSTASDFIQSFGVLIPQTVAGSLAGIPWNSATVFLNTGQASGFDPLYQNSPHDGPRGNGDQGHHFAAFLAYGFMHSSTWNNSGNRL